jgi:hypothetical protein
LKHAPEESSYKPYIGAADNTDVTKTDDDREVTKSRIHNIYQEELDEVIRIEKE